jgi:hypothetical protein
MLDMLFVGLIVMFFLVAIGYVHFCDRLSTVEWKSIGTDSLKEDWGNRPVLSNYGESVTQSDSRPLLIT